MNNKTKESLEKLFELTCKDFSIEATRQYNNLKKGIENMELENKVLENRLNHLLESNFISEYDRKNPLTSNYELDINELDKIFNKVKEFQCKTEQPLKSIRHTIFDSELWQKENPLLSNNNDDDIFACTFDELLTMIKQRYKRIKVTRELYAQLEDKLYNVKHNNEDPISSFFGIEIYIDL